MEMVYLFQVHQFHKLKRSRKQFNQIQDEVDYTSDKQKHISSDKAKENYITCDKRNETYKVGTQKQRGKQKLALESSYTTPPRIHA